MAVPTIVSVSPATIWTGGQLISISGTNFQTWTVPSTQSAKLAAPTPTVKVTVDGEDCTDVKVFSSTLLTCRAPRHDVTVSALGVTVANLDANGAVISGETATLASALTYKRPDLTDEPDLERLNRAVVLELRRQVLENVLMFVSADWAESPYEWTATAKLPALVLSGPTITQTRTPYATNSEIETGGHPGVTHDRLRVPLTVDLTYDLTVLTDNTQQSINLQTLVAQFFDRNQTIRLLRDPADVNKGYVYYDMEIPVGVPLRSTTEPNKNNVRSFVTSFVVLGVAVESLASFANENRTAAGEGVVDLFTFTPLKKDI